MLSCNCVEIGGVTLERGFEATSGGITHFDEGGKEKINDDGKGAKYRDKTLSK